MGAMKLKITGVNKANDEVVHLYNIPFDATRRDVVATALKTLGDTVDEVSNVVTLKRRTNEALYFDFSGPDTKLKSFFDKYYNHMKWDQIRTKFGAEKEAGENESTEVDFETAIRKYMRTKYKVNPKKIKYSAAPISLMMTDVQDDTIDKIQADLIQSRDHPRELKLIRKLDESKLTITEFMKKYKFVIEDTFSKNKKTKDGRKYSVTTYKLKKIRK